VVALIPLVACSFSSDPLLPGGGGPGEDHSPASGRDPGEERDSGRDPVVPADSGAAGNGGQAGMTAPEPATGDAAAPDSGSPPIADAGPAGAADANPGDAATIPDPPDSVADAATEPDTGTPPDPDCECVCPHELKDALSKPRDPSCKLVECAAAECAPDPSCSYSKHGKSGYYICDELHTWEDAQEHCDELEDTYLASIDDREEDEHLLGARDDKLWVGGNDLAKEGELAWQNGDVFWRGGAAFSDDSGPGGGGPGGGGPGGAGPGGGGPGGEWQSGGPVNGAYANFISYEPNDQGLEGSDGDCLMLWPEQQSWADASCDDPHGYVCEFELPP
jgi:hypothetical protein